MTGHRARRRFGQNFLHDPAVIRRLVTAIDPRPGEPIVEIGPGQGALSAPLLQAGAVLTAVELDRDLIEPLEATLAGLGPARVHQADALELDLASCHHGQNLRVVGNLPYNVATPLLFHLFEQADRIRDIHVMLQREVVDRMVAQPGTRTYGRLSVMTQHHCHAERLFTVARGAFRPAPKVTSAVVRLTPRPDAAPGSQATAALSRVVARAFSQRRKTLRNTLGEWFSDNDLAACGVDPGQRAEALDLQQYRCLAAHPSHTPDDEPVQR